MALKPKPSVSGKSWALAQRRLSSRTCETCAFGRKVPEFARFVAEAWAEKESGRAPHVTRRSLHAYVVEHFGYPLTDTGMRRHLQICLARPSE